MDIGLTLGPSVVVGVDDGETTDVLRNRSGKERTPAVVQLRPDEIVVGREAQNEQLLYPDRTVDLRPAQFGADEVLTVDDKTYSGADLWEMVLTEVHHDIEQRIDSARDTVTFAVPDDFPTEHRRRLTSIAENVGFSDIVLVNHSTVTCNAAGRIPGDGESMLVCHVDGGTVTSSAIERGAQEPDPAESRRSEGGSHEAHLEELVETFSAGIRDEGLTDPEENEALKENLYESLRSLDVALSEEDSAHLAVGMGTNIFEYEVDRDEFARVVSSPVEETLELVGLLRETHEGPPIEDVLVVGEQTAVRNNLAAAIGGHLGLETVTCVDSSDLAPNTASYPEQREASTRSVDPDEWPGYNEAPASITTDGAGDDQSGPAEIDPNASDPFEVLGVTPHTPLDEIRHHASEQALRTDEEDLIQAVSEAVETIEEGPHVKAVGETTVLPLDVTADATCIDRGDEVTVTVTDLVDPVEDAEVHVDDRWVGQTDSDGTHSVRMNEEGEVEIRVTAQHSDEKTEYASGTTTVEVQTPDDADSGGDVDGSNSREDRADTERDVASSDPFDVLGVPRDTPLETIREHTQELVAEHDDIGTVHALTGAYKEIEAGPHVMKVGGTVVEPLQVDVDSTRVEVGRPVQLTVTDITGTPVEDASLTVNDVTRAKTDQNGEATIEISETGRHEVTAARAHPRSSYEYASGTVHVDIVQRMIELRFAASPDETTVGESFRVRVTDDGGRPVANVRVQAAGTATRTDSDGAAEIALSTPGQAVLEARKADSARSTYESATTTVNVVGSAGGGGADDDGDTGGDEGIDDQETPDVVPLTIEPPSDPVEPGEPVTFKVTDVTGDPVESVHLSGTDADSDRTDADGRGTLTFAAAGETTVSASKNTDANTHTYESASVSVSVQRRTEQLQFRSLPDAVEVDETVRVRVGSEATERIEGANVEAEEGTDARTDEEGWAYVKFTAPGEQPVTASKPPTDTTTYDPVTETITVDSGGQQSEHVLKFTDMPTSVGVGDTVNVRVCEEGDGGVEGVSVRAEDGTEATTDEEGRAFVKFGKEGVKQLTATKQSTESDRYEAVETTVEVSERADE